MCFLHNQSVYLSLFSPPLKKSHFPISRRLI
nr:MAG TPA: hypothetical protein [Caudoviricetes sp.]